MRKIALNNKFIGLMRLFKYVDIKSALFYLKQKLSGNHFVPITLKDGTHTHALSAILLNWLPYKSPMSSLKDDLFSWEIQNEKWVASYEQVVGLEEYMSHKTHTMYAADYKNKIVLDIGGFIGDTARFFLKEGARRVHIFEPVKKNIAAMLLNLEDYMDFVSIDQKALSHTDGKISLFSHARAGCNTFSMDRGPYQEVCQGITIKSILEQGHIDIAKVDCEGGEKYLLSADQKTLKKVNYWIIETHNMKIHQNIVNKFQSIGFNQLQQFYVAEGVYVVHFSLPFSSQDSDSS